MDSHLFLSYSGERAEGFAKELSRLIRQVLDTEAWLASNAMRCGDNWPVELVNALMGSSMCIVCLTKGNRFQPYIYFEAGAMVRHVGGRPIVPRVLDRARADAPTPRFDDLFILSLDPIRPGELPGALRLFQVRMVDRESFLDVILRIKVAAKRLNEERVKRDFERHWPDVETALQRIRLDETQAAEVETGMSELVDSLGHLAGAAELHGNRYFRRLLVVSMEDYKKRLDQVRDAQPVFRLPHVLYPAFLIDLMKTYKADVKAIALVEYEEHFWDGVRGYRILDWTPATSKRVFVFSR
jgi:hypothetical protein